MEVMVGVPSTTFNPTINQGLMMTIKRFVILLYA
jgi:hypothetical protein